MSAAASPSTFHSGLSTLPPNDALAASPLLANRVVEITYWTEEQLQDAEARNELLFLYPAYFIVGLFLCLWAFLCCNLCDFKRNRSAWRLYLDALNEHEEAELKQKARAERLKMREAQLRREFESGVRILDAVRHTRPPPERAAAAVDSTASEATAPTGAPSAPAASDEHDEPPPPRLSRVVSDNDRLSSITVKTAHDEDEDRVEAAEKGLPSPFRKRHPKGYVEADPEVLPSTFAGELTALAREAALDAVAELKQPMRRLKRVGSIGLDALNLMLDGSKEEEAINVLTERALADLHGANQAPAAVAAPRAAAREAAPGPAPAFQGKPTVRFA